MPRNTEQDNQNKFRAVVELVRGIQPYYRSADASAQQLIETTIGAAIFYLPSNKSRLWSGMISESLRDLDRSQWCADHMYPRKVSAMKLLGIDWSKIADPAQFLSDLYYSELGRFHYVTKQENARLKHYQDPSRFKDPQQAYKDCGITLVSER